MTSAAEGGWRVADGTIRVYRLFDVADAIDLGRAEALAGAPTSRVRLEGSRTHSAIEIPRPPLRLALGPRTLPLPSGERPCQARANLLDYGVGGVLYELPIPPGTPLEELPDEPTPALDAAPRGEAEALAAALGPALEQFHASASIETYTVFFV